MHTPLLSVTHGALKLGGNLVFSDLHFSVNEGEKAGR